MQPVSQSKKEKKKKEKKKKKARQTFKESVWKIGWMEFSSAIKLLPEEKRRRSPSYSDDYGDDGMVSYGFKVLDGDDLMMHQGHLPSWPSHASIAASI